MKKKLTVLAAAMLAAGALASGQDAAQQAAQAAAQAISGAPAAAEIQKPVYWERSTDIALGFNQTKLTNWAAGGFNTYVLSSNIDSKANYKKDLMNWNNRLQLDYGFLYSSDKEGILQKSSDRMYLESSWGYKTSKSSKWSYSASYDFRSQFTRTPNKYIQNEAGEWFGDGLKSGFFSPAYTNIALGMEWVPTNWFSVNIAPLTGGFTICSIPELRKSYGMKLKDPDTAEDPELLGADFRSALFQFGAQIKANFKMTINDVFAYDTQLVLFSNYLDRPQDLRVNWDNKISWQVAKFIKLTFSTWLIYDPIVSIKSDKDIDIYPNGTQRVQFKENFLINFAYTFKPRK